MKKCPKSVTGRHLWMWVVIKNNDTKNGKYWVVEGSSCALCHIFDDRGVSFPEDMPINYKYER